MKDELSVRGVPDGKLNGRNLGKRKPGAAFAGEEKTEPEPKFGGLRPLSNAASLAGRGEASTTKSLQSKLHDAFAQPANRGILEAAITVERIQKLRGRVA